MCVRGGRSCGYLSQSSAAVSLKPDTRVWCVWVPIMPCKRKKCWTANAMCRLDPSPTPKWHSSSTTRNPAKSTDRSNRDSRYSRSSSRTAHEAVFHNRPSLHENLLCRSDWLRLRRISETECMILLVRELTAFPRRNGSCRPQRFSTNSAGSQIQCLGLGAWAEQTAPALGAQTGSTTQIRISGNCAWMWTETGATTDWRATRE